MSTGIILAHSFPARPSLSGAQQAELASILDRLRTRIAHYRPLVLPHFQDYDRQHRGTVTHDQFARVLTIVKSELSSTELALLTNAYLNEDIARVDYRRFLSDVDNTGTEKHAVNDEAKEFDIVNQNRIFVRDTTGAADGRRGDGGIDGILSKIKSLIVIKRISLYELFDDFDPLRHRTITRSQFKRCLTSGGFHLSVGEVDRLCEAFAASKSEVAYQQFERAINSAFVPEMPELAKTMPIDYTPTTTTTAIVTDNNTANIAKGSVIDGLLCQLSYISSTRRILIKPAFAAYDRHGAGYVTEAAFKSVLTGLFPTFPFSEAQIALLLQTFTSADKGVSYSLFCQEINGREREYEDNLTALDSVTASQVGIDSGAKIDNVADIKYNFSSTLSQPITNYGRLMQSLHDTLASWRLHIDTIFDDFDRLHRGCVTKTVFYRCLTMAGLRLRAEEIDVLAHHYAVQSEDCENQVNFKQFVRDLSPVPRIN